MVSTEPPERFEWNDGELIRFNGMNRKQVYIYDALNRLFVKKGCLEIGTLYSKYLFTI